MRTQISILAMAASSLLGMRQAAAQAYCPSNDVDRYPFGWATNKKLLGPEDFDANGNGNFNGDPNVACFHLSASDGFVTMADGRSQYVFGFAPLPLDTPADEAMASAILAAQLPAPTLVVREGQQVFLTLTNVGMMMRPDLFDPHSVHWHGFPNASAFYDGVPEASVAVKPNAAFTYYYTAADPGTYMYHCHVEVVEHMQMGMTGQIYVLPAQDGTDYEHPVGSGRHYSTFAYNDGDGSTGYDVAYPIQLADFDPEFHDANLAIQPLPFAYMTDRYHLMNGRGYPDTVVPGAIDGIDPDGNVYAGRQPVSSLIEAAQGQRILLRLSSLSTTSYHTIQALGIAMRVVGKSARLLRGPLPWNRDLSYLTSSVTLGGGESADVILDTLGVAPGTYYLYSRNFGDLVNNTQDRGGMMTEIRIH